MKRIAVLWAVAILAVAGCTGGNEGTLAVTGLLEGEGVEAGSRVGGRVAEVLVDEGDPVKQGDVLVRLETEDAEAALAAAKAQLAQAEAANDKIVAGARPEQVRQAEAALDQLEQQYQMALKGARSQEVDTARAAVEAARAQRNEAKSEFTRAQRLYDEKVLSQQLYDKAKHAFEAAQAQLDGASEQLAMVVEGARSEEISMAKAARDRAAAVLDEVKNGARSEDVAAAKALRDAAAAKVRLAESQLSEMTVTAPCNGVVESIDILPGDLTGPGPLVRIIDPDDLEIVIYVSAKTMGRLRLGQPVSLTMDSFGEESFEGKIVHIANEGEYTPRNLQTEEARAQQMFGIKLNLNSAGGRLKAGMTATAHLDLTQGAPAS